MTKVVTEETNSKPKAPSHKVRELKVEQLRKRTMFQNRTRCSTDSVREAREMKAHVAELKQQIKADGLLDPIEVYNINGDYFVVNGHHRLAAVIDLRWDKVRCKVTKGSEEEAWRAAMEANQKASKPLSAKERTQVAWSAIVDPERSYYRERLLTTSSRSFANIWAIAEATIRRMLEVMEAIAKQTHKSKAKGHKWSKEELAEVWLNTERYPITPQISYVKSWKAAQGLLKERKEPNDAQQFEFKKSRALSTMIDALMLEADMLDQDSIKAAVETLLRLTKSNDFEEKLTDASEEAKAIAEASSPEYEDQLEGEDYDF